MKRLIRILFKINQNSISMKEKTHKTKFVKLMFAIMLIFLTFNSCRKNDFVLQNNSQNYEDLKAEFFNTSITNDTEVKYLAADIKKQDSIFKFLPDFVRKNGIPKWDKVFYKTNKGTSLYVKQKSISINSISTSSQTTNSSSNSQGIFFIPLQSQNSNEIKSYITAYKHNDSLYSYRLYNKDSINKIVPKTKVEEQNLLTTQSVFGHFEKDINNADSVIIGGAKKGIIKNARISFEPPTELSKSTYSSQSFTHMDCSMTISIYVVYEYSPATSWTYDHFQIVAAVMVVQIDCSGGGGGSIGGGGGNWWNYGSGWPWYGGGGGNDPSWGFWWTSGGGGIGIPQEIFPDPNVLGNFIDDPSIFEDDPTQVTFDYNRDPWPTINNVLSTSQFVEYDYRNCLALTQDQISKAALRDLGYGSAYKIYDANGGPYPNTTKSGMNYIITKLQAGKPVIVGVDNRQGTPSSVNADGKTDHFITIVGSGQDSQGKYLQFYDNATNNSSKGCSSSNKLYYNERTGIITGYSAANGAPPTYYDYIVTQIRKNQ